MVGLARGVMATGLTGAQPGWQVFRGSAEAQSSLHVSAFLSRPAPKQRHQRLQMSTEGGGGGALTATEVLVCFGLLLITVWDGGKASVSAATSSVKTLSGQLAGRDTHCSLVWLPSGRNGALKTGVHSPGTPACTEVVEDPNN